MLRDQYIWLQLNYLVSKNSKSALIISSSVKKNRIMKALLCPFHGFERFPNPGFDEKNAKMNKPRNLLVTVIFGLANFIKKALAGRSIKE